jgi:hypothetical protein
MLGRHQVLGAYQPAGQPLWLMNQDRQAVDTSLG